MLSFYLDPRLFLWTVGAILMLLSSLSERRSIQFSVCIWKKWAEDALPSTLRSYAGSIDERVWSGSRQHSGQVQDHLIRQRTSAPIGEVSDQEISSPAAVYLTYKVLANKKKH